MAIHYVCMLACIIKRSKQCFDACKVHLCQMYVHTNIFFWFDRYVWKLLVHPNVYVHSQRTTIVYPNTSHMMQCRTYIHNHIYHITCPHKTTATNQPFLSSVIKMHGKNRWQSYFHYYFRSEFCWILDSDALVIHAGGEKVKGSSRGLKGNGKQLLRPETIYERSKWSHVCSGHTASIWSLLTGQCADKRINDHITPSSRNFGITAAW